MIKKHQAPDAKGLALREDILEKVTKASVNFKPAWTPSHLLRARQQYTEVIGFRHHS